MQKFSESSSNQEVKEKSQTKDSNEIPRVSIVVPLFNESETFPMLIQRLDALSSSLKYKVEIVLVDDGSSDDTPFLMRQLALIDAKYHCIFLARNHGHQLALTSGLAFARASEAIMVIDGDLQDPPELLPKLYSYYLEGYDVVYAIRIKRKEGWLKRTAYHAFYRILSKISYIDIPLDSGDFSLMSRRVVDVLNRMPEESRYIRGMRTWIGFQQIGVEYEREERFAGDSKYSFKRLLKLAFNGIFNFSEFPIKFITTLGLISFTSAIIYLITVIIKKYFLGTVPLGFTALLFTIILFNGVILLSIGILGEYIIRIFFQVKGRPKFIIKERIEQKESTL